MNKIIDLVVIFAVLAVCCVRESVPVNEGTSIPEITKISSLEFQPDSLKVTNDVYFNLAFQEINQMLEGSIPLNFKRSVFLIEWAYLKGELDYEDFSSQISKNKLDLINFIAEKGIGKFKTAGNFALFEFFTKPHKMNNFKPFVYDFNDFYGNMNYRNIFVSKLLETHKGQCRSMPMYYKILSEEIGAKRHLALAPNHLYIKHLDEQGKWVNIELTNGNFSTDSWMISSLDITAESIRKGVYMRELAEVENIAFCLYELGVAYQKNNGFSEFGLLCTNNALRYFPNCMPALMNKSNTLRQFGLDYISKNGRKESPFILQNYKSFQETERKIEELGFRELSPERYKTWVNSMEENYKKLSNSN